MITDNAVWVHASDELPAVEENQHSVSLSIIANNHPFEAVYWKEKKAFYLKNQQEEIWYTSDEADIYWLKNTIPETFDSAIEKYAKANAILFAYWKENYMNTPGVNLAGVFSNEALYELFEQRT